MVSGYDLDVHLNYTTGVATVRARLNVRNVSQGAVGRLPLSVSSSMRWQSVRVGGEKAAFEERLLPTDADHTGKASEAWIALPKELAAGAAAEVDAFYEGPLVEDAARLTGVGAPVAQASASDWDGFNFAAATSGVRGFGNVLWYPVAAPALWLGKGNELFAAVAAERARGADVAFRLRLTVESPVALSAAFFCGEMQALREAGADEPAQAMPASDAGRVYTAEWRRERVGVRVPSLFVTSAKAVAAESGLMDAYTAQADAVPAYDAAVRAVRPVMEAWLGARPLRKLVLLDLGARAALPFQDDNLVVLPMRAGSAAALEPVMAEWLTHVYFRGAEEWMSAGLGAFMQRVWSEREARGEKARLGEDREAALALALYETSALATAEGASSSSSADKVERPGLSKCADPVCYRTKGAAVWRMLRFMAGESALKQALQAFRETGGGAGEFESLLEKTSGKDLGWFFDEWVMHDRGLPDLSIVEVAPRPVTSTTSEVAGKGSKTANPAGQRTRETGGWMVAVEVRNEGDATAEVPVTLRGDGFSSTEPMRIAPRSRATMRMLVPGKPTEVQVNDGTVPEVRADAHVRALQVQVSK